MASNLGINPNTVKKAYEELEKKGVITVISTKGTFISENIDSVIESKINEKIIQIKNIIEELERYGISKAETLERIS